jgi:phosphoesterase RecJ-like protein
MIDYKILRQKLELLPKSTIVLIAGHKNADYDSIGSCIALAHILTKLGYAAYALLEDKDMSKAEWLNTSLVINEYTAEQPFNFILLDSPRKERLGKFEPLFDKALLTICIDHHEIQKCEATYTFVDEYISSTAEIIANLAKGYANIMDKNIATHLYAGIVSDTNSFYRRVIPSTMTVASMLMQYNVDNTFVVKNQKL